MKLETLVAGLAPAVGARMHVPGIAGPDAEVVIDPEISDLAYDSRQAGPGTLFFCVSGFERDGHDYAPEAVDRGAVALVVERELDLALPQVVVASVRAAMGPLAARFFGDPSRHLRVIGITGTNGKTTTAFLVRELLEGSGRRCALLSTVKSVIGGQERDVVRTTPEAIDIQRVLAEMLASRDGFCAMEVSSHALALGRADAIHFAAAVFTNLTQDHLDFHNSMEDYYLAKRRLFGAPVRGQDGSAARAPEAAIINVDDRYGRRLAQELGPVTTFAIDAAADYRARDVVSDLHGSRYVIATPDGELEVRSPLPGRFNVHNVLGAVAAARALSSRASPQRCPPRGVFPAASSRSRRDRASPCSSTMRTRPTDWRTCCVPRRSSRAGASSACSARAVTGTAPSARRWGPSSPGWPTWRS